MLTVRLTYTSGVFWCQLKSRLGVRIPTSLGRNVKYSRCQRLWEKLIKGNNVIGHVCSWSMFSQDNISLHYSSLPQWWVSMIILTLQCSVSCRAWFIAKIINWGFSYPCVQLSFISFGFARLFRETEQYTTKWNGGSTVCQCFLKLPVIKNINLPLSTWEIMNHTYATGCDRESRERWFVEVAMQLLEFIFGDWIPC